VADDQNVDEVYGFDWRRLFRIFRPETLPDHFWGRGPVEVLWNTNKVEDTMLSRTADASLLAAIPKPWFRLEDKDTVESIDGGLDNDPTKPGYYRVNPPVYPQAQASPDNMKLYTAMKEDAQRQQGISDVTYGKSPGAAPAARLVQILLQQNQIIVTGEANQAMNEVVEDIVETKLMMWRRFYTEPRWFIINGNPEALVLSRLLKVFKVKDPQSGAEQEKEIPEFQISVSPNSNFPQMWEINLSLFIELANVKKEDGTPLIPPEAILDHLAQRFPNLGRNGEYYKQSQATAIGMKVLQQQQLKLQQQAALEKKITDRATNQGIQRALPQPQMGQPTEVQNG
jgi:hypothetical protein